MKRLEFAESAPSGLTPETQGAYCPFISLACILADSAMQIDGRHVSAQ